MPVALKLQATAGTIVDYDCTGGEPNDTHETLFELDPAPEDAVAFLDAKVSDLVDPDMTVGQLVNLALDKALPDVQVPIFGAARLQLRKMDSDGRA